MTHVLHHNNAVVIIHEQRPLIENSCKPSLNLKKLECKEEPHRFSGFRDPLLRTEIFDTSSNYSSQLYCFILSEVTTYYRHNAILIISICQLYKPWINNVPSVMLI